MLSRGVETLYPGRGAGPQLSSTGQALDAFQHPRPDLFRDALARLAGGLAIVSFWEQGRPQGLLVSSIVGLSVEPPRFLFCVRKEASCHDALVRTDLLSVAILSDEDEEAARAFTAEGDRSSRFTGPHWRLDAIGAPLYVGGLSAAECVVAACIDAGTHSILAVTAQSLKVRTGAPLLAFDRALRTLA
jgi:flavin reductase